MSIGKSFGIFLLIIGSKYTIDTEFGSELSDRPKGLLVSKVIRTMVIVSAL